MEYYDKYGHAQAVKKGDKYSYDYYGNIINARAWAQYSRNFGNLGVNLGGELDILLCGVMVFGKKGCSLTILKETLKSKIT